MRYVAILPGTAHEGTDLPAGIDIPEEVATSDEQVRAHFAGHVAGVEDYDILRETRGDVVYVTFERRPATQGEDGARPSEERRDWLVSFIYTYLHDGARYHYCGGVLDATYDEALAAARRDAGVTVTVDLGGDIERVIFNDAGDEYEMSTSEEEPEEFTESLYPLDHALRHQLTVLDAEGCRLTVSEDLAALLVNTFRRAEPPAPDGGQGMLFNTEPAPSGCAHFRVNYDPGYTGGDYHGTGLFAHIPFALLGQGLTPEEAFTHATGVAAVHVIHYSLDESYDAAGDRLEGDDAAAFDAIQNVTSRTTIPDALTALSLFCRAFAADQSENTSAWGAASELIARARYNVLGLGRGDTRTLPAQLGHPHDRHDPEAARGHIRTFLGRLSVRQALGALARQCRVNALHDDEARDALRAAAVFIETASEEIGGFEPSAGLNY